MDPPSFTTAFFFGYVENSRSFYPSSPFPQIVCRSWGLVLPCSEKDPLDPRNFVVCDSYPTMALVARKKKLVWGAPPFRTRVSGLGSTSFNVCQGRNSLTPGKSKENYWEQTKQGARHVVLLLGDLSQLSAIEIRPKLHHVFDFVTLQSLPDTGLQLFELHTLSMNSFLYPGRI